MPDLSDCTGTLVSRNESGWRPERLGPDIEEFRDVHWRRDERYRVETVEQADRFVEEVGFATTFTDSRKPGPSLYIAVCGRRDVVMPRNVQTDPETSLTWQLKDELMRRGRVYYAKLARGKTMCIAPRTIPWFRAVWGVGRVLSGRHVDPVVAKRRVVRVFLTCPDRARRHTLDGMRNWPVFATGMIVLALVACAPGEEGQAPDGERIDVSLRGPQVGETIPDFTLRDQYGATWTRESIAGENGTMLVFIRSADW